MPDMIIAKTSDDNKNVTMLSQMSNRHGLVAGATGTGKTVTLQALAEHFSSIGTAVFAADIKGDLSGVSQPGGGNPKVDDRLKQLKITDHSNEAFPVQFWDVFGEQGTPIRSTVSEMGPLLLARLLECNEVQEGVLNIVFKFADDNGLLLLDLKDLRAMVQYIGEHASEMNAQYGMVSTASIGAIQRGLLSLESQDGGTFFGEPAIKLTDFIRSEGGKGVINILAADKLFQRPKLYTCFMLWLLSELYENLPEAGDMDKPKLVFFFDEAHLLFDNAPKELLDKIEQVIRLIRSKAVGVYFVTQNPADVPESVLGQLGNRVQHALRAFTPADQKGIREAAQTFRPNPKFKVEEVITQLGVGEALVSFLDEKGAPQVTDRAFIVPPQGHIGAIDASSRSAIMNSSQLHSQYAVSVDNDSAYERITAKAQESAAAQSQQSQEAPKSSRGSGRMGMAETIEKSVLRSFSSRVGTQIARGILGGIFGGK
jgi:uncharacterized protein